MSKALTIVTARSGVTLLLLFILSLTSSRLDAHEVHNETGQQHSELVLSQSNDDVRDLLRRFRQTGDDGWLDLAWSTVETELPSNDTQLLLDAAFVAQARHKFDQALEFTHRVLTQQPNFDQAWLLLASIHLVRGETTAAGQACDKLQASTWLVAVSCHTRVAHANGNAAKVRDAFERLVDTTIDSQTDDNVAAWALSIAGDLAVATGDREQAVEYFVRSLALVESTQVRAALVDVLIEERQLARARDALDQGAAALPLNIRRMIVAKLSGQNADLAVATHHADHEFQSWIEREDWLHAREMARFYLDVAERPLLAKRLAEINYATQREPEDRRLWQRTRL